MGLHLSHPTRESDNDTRCSQAVTHPSTNRAWCCLTSVTGRELVFSPWYGRCWREAADLFTLPYADTVIGRVVGVGGGVFGPAPPSPSVFFRPGLQTDMGA